MASKSTTAGDVLLYVPNLIGYLRVICTVLSLILMICFPQRWIIAIILYVASFVGDLFDGLAARKFDQCSIFGGLLDMVTDRCSTAGLLCVLSHEHNKRPILVLVRDTTYVVVCSVQRFCSQLIHSFFSSTLNDNFSAIYNAHYFGHIISLVSNVLHCIIKTTSQIC